MQWVADGSHYVDFPARPETGASTVAFMAYLPDGEQDIRFRGVLLRESTGEVLLRVQG